MVECSSDNCLCRSNASLPYIWCHLCQTFIHAKCAGVKAVVADAIKDSNVSIYWICKKCKLPANKLFLVLRKMHEAYNDINKKFKDCSESFEKINDAFKEYKCLEELGSASELNQKADTKADTNSTTSASSSSSMTLNSLIIPPIPDTLSPMNDSSLLTSLASHDSSNGTLSSSHANRLPSSQFLTAPNLIVANPLKSVFISRLHISTTENDVLDYILFRHQNLKSSEVIVSKFKFKSVSRRVASFRISIPSNSSLDILNPSFWPDGLIVHEYITRPKPPNIPSFTTQSPSSISKNL